MRKELRAQNIQRGNLENEQNLFAQSYLIRLSVDNKYI
jgi:hypothetical protein